ncbi:PREDICTED: 39S ribosomal protein L44, mitochondrial-like [Priapulus caudatus]|uniref:Large ribosomal subunit protein mL44 n=1 Tax=Priapulus caudatus TaxID=37621 RepID=A0ABM1EW34_PRICU|nr:PREDICTED: 39S ribosomal protein L44, mitochondrial-like [Priapulus caudatus]
MAACRKALTLCRLSSRIESARFFHRWQRPTFQQLYKLRKMAGPEAEKPRSAQTNWNRDGELYAFGERLGELLGARTLDRAFTHESYVAREEEERRRLGIAREEEEGGKLDVDHNGALIERGTAIVSTYTKAYLRHQLPNLPEEGICAIHDYLTSDNMLEYIGSNLGMKDLILSEDFPVRTHTVGQTFRAVVGALANDQGEERAQLFVQDFVLTQLVNQDVSEMWTLVNPMGVLTMILQQRGMVLPEPRILRSTGSSTVVACYVVGIYSNKQLIGQAPGETEITAEEMAARDALAGIFGIRNAAATLKLGTAGRHLTIDPAARNPSLDSLCGRPLGGDSATVSMAAT